MSTSCCVSTSGSQTRAPPNLAHDVALVTPAKQRVPSRFTWTRVRCGRPAFCVKCLHAWVLFFFKKSLGRSSVKPATAPTTCTCDRTTAQSSVGLSPAAHPHPAPLLQGWTVTTPSPPGDTEPVQACASSHRASPSPAAGPAGVLRLHPPPLGASVWQPPASPTGDVGFSGLVCISHLSFTPVFSFASTLRSPSSPIHEEDEEKLSQDSDAPPPLSGAGLALSSSPEVRPPPRLAETHLSPCPHCPSVGLPDLWQSVPWAASTAAHAVSSAGFPICGVGPVWGAGVSSPCCPPTACSPVPRWRQQSCGHTLSSFPRAL